MARKRRLAVRGIKRQVSRTALRRSEGPVHADSALRVKPGRNAIQRFFFLAAFFLVTKQGPPFDLVVQGATMPLDGGKYDINS